MSIDAVAYNNQITAMKIEPLEETIDQIEFTLKNRHIERLKNGSCAIDRGVHFLDTLSDMERISDHCSNVGVHVLNRHIINKGGINRHEYIKSIHKGETKEYAEAFNKYHEKYNLK